MENIYLIYVTAISGDKVIKALRTRVKVDDIAARGYGEPDV
jgi:hypothetical protein